MEHLDPSVRKHQDWFDQNNTEIQALRDEKYQVHKTFINDQGSQSKTGAYNSTRRKVQTKLREVQNAWYCKRADEIQHYADTKKTKLFYHALKTISRTEQRSYTDELNTLTVY